VEFEIMMPALSPTMEKGTLVRWLVHEGEPVSTGDLLAEIETDKASMEFEAAKDGILSRIIVGDGAEDVPVGTVIGLIGDLQDGPAPEDGVVASMGERTAEIAGPSEAALPAGPSEDPMPPARTITQSGVLVSPLAGRIAAQRSIDLERIRGSGPSGRIMKADLGLTKMRAALVPAPNAEPVPPDAVRTLPVPKAAAAIPHEIVKLSGMRRTIARRLTESKQTIPHFYLSVDIRLDELLALRRELNALEASPKLSVNDFLIKALARALVATPDANVQFADDALLHFKRADISVAVAIPGGLVTPVIADAGSKRMSQIAAEFRALTERARAGKLVPEDYQGGTASLSNLGMYGMGSIIPVLSPPQAVIVGVGAGEERPYAVNGALGLATVMNATGSFDHRAIDGAAGAEMMRSFKGLLENPLLLLV
jgi:pyruvate dehydrogenase E2 component (dihydrolipoamide acetyltransferase)